MGYSSASRKNSRVRAGIYGIPLVVKLRDGELTLHLGVTVERLQCDDGEESEVREISMVGGRVENKGESFSELRREYVEETGSVHHGAMRQLGSWFDHDEMGRVYENEFVLMTGCDVSNFDKQNMLIFLPWKAFKSSLEAEDDLVRGWVRKAWKESEVLTSLTNVFDKLDESTLDDLMSSGGLSLAWDSEYFVKSQHKGTYMIETLPKNSEEERNEVVVKWRKTRLPTSGTSIESPQLERLLTTFYMTPLPAWSRLRDTSDLVDILDEIRSGSLMDAVVLHPLIEFLK